MSGIIKVGTGPDGALEPFGTLVGDVEFSTDWPKMAADISASFVHAFETLLDDTLAPIEATGELTWVMPEGVYHQVKTWQARGMWREAYRAARVLENRQLAFEFIGERRVFDV